MPAPHSGAVPRRLRVTFERALSARMWTSPKGERVFRRHSPHAAIGMSVNAQSADASVPRIGLKDIGPECSRPVPTANPVKSSPARTAGLVRPPRSRPPRCLRRTGRAGKFCSLRNPWRGWVAVPPSSSAVGVPRSRAGVSSARSGTPGADGWLRHFIHPLSGFLARGTVSALLAPEPLARMGGCATLSIRCRGSSLAGRVMNPAQSLKSGCRHADDEGTERVLSRCLRAEVRDDFFMWNRLTGLWIALLVLQTATIAHCQVLRAYIPPRQSTGYSRTQPGVQMVPASGTVAVRHVAILGNIGKPGVFPLSRTAKLTDLVEAAGGLTTGSTGQFRIIRGGRGNLKVWFSPQSTFTLMPDDVALAEGSSHAQGAGRVLSGQRNVRLSELANATAPARVTLVLLRFIDRPVVVDLPVDQAHLQGLMVSLRHPPRGTFTLVGATGVPETATMPQSALTPLKPGTVVIADPSEIDRAALPALPAPIGTVRPTIEPRPQETAFLPPSPQPEIRATAAPAVEPAEEETQLPDAPQMNAPVFPTAPNILVPTPVDTPEPAVTVPQAFTAEETATEPRPAPQRTIQRDVSKSSRPATIQVTKQKVASPPYLFIFMSTCSVFGLALFVLTELERRKFSAKESLPLPPIGQTKGGATLASQSAVSTGSETTSSHPRYSLDALIKDELEYLELPVVLPTDLEFSGQPARTAQHRLDAPIAGPEPHFVADVVTDPAMPNPQLPRVNRSKIADVLSRTLNPVPGTPS